MGQIETRGVADTDGNLALYLVGRVLEAGKHPNADRLQLCSVDVGEGEPRQIVCGAWNFGAGATVAVALPGAVLPDGRTLERAKLRGSVSDGMILSEQELELGDDHAGIIVLPDEWEPGTPLVDALPLSDVVLELETTHNRPDLLGVYGIAREVAAIFDLALAPPPGVDPEQAGDEPVAITIDDLEGCPRYVGRLFRDVAVAPSPHWLKARLVAAGMRPISNVVDVTNYVMHALGSPLHAFDFDTLAGGRIGVRRARAGEQLRTLDGQLRSLEPRDLLITDGERAIAIAGIMGGEETEVTESTTSVLLEAANFEPVGIMRSSERLRLRSEASNRWEKGVDPEAGAPGGTLRDRAARLAGRRALDGARRRSRRACGAGDDLVPPRAGGAGRRASRSRRRSSAGASTRLGFEVGRRVGGSRPLLARGRRHAGDRPRRGGRALRPRARAGNAADAHGAERAADAARSASGGASRTRSSGFGFAEAYTWSLLPDDPDAGRDPAARAALERAGACSGRRSPTVWSRRLFATSTQGTTTSRCSSSPTSTCPAASSSRTSAGTSAASSKAASRAQRAPWRACTRRCT